MPPVCSGVGSYWDPTVLSPEGVSRSAPTWATHPARSLAVYKGDEHVMDMTPFFAMAGDRAWTASYDIIRPGSDRMSVRDKESVFAAVLAKRQSLQSRYADTLREYLKESERASSNGDTSRFHDLQAGLLSMWEDINTQAVQQVNDTLEIRTETFNPSLFLTAGCASTVARHQGEIGDRNPSINLHRVGGQRRVSSPTDDGPMVQFDGRVTLHKEADGTKRGIDYGWGIAVGPASAESAPYSEAQKENMLEVLADCISAAGEASPLDREYAIPGHRKGDPVMRHLQDMHSVSSALIADSIARRLKKRRDANSTGEVCTANEQPSLYAGFQAQTASFGTDSVNV